MAKKPETRFKEKIVPKLKALGGWGFKTQQVALMGIPDILWCFNGLFVALELKATKHDKATKLQQKILDDIKAAGGYAEVVHPDNWEEIYADLKVLATVG